MGFAMTDIPCWQRAALEALTQGGRVLVTTLEGHILDASPALLADVGLDRASAINHSESCMTSERHTQAFWDNRRATLGQGVVWKGRFIVWGGDGDQIVHEATDYPILRDGTVERVVSIRTLVGWGEGPALAEDRTLFGQDPALEPSGLAFVLHPDGETLEVSGELLHRLGYPTPSRDRMTVLSVRTALARVHIWDRNRLRAAIQGWKRGKEARPLEARLRSRAGTYGLFQVSATTQPTLGGPLIGELLELSTLDTHFHLAASCLNSVSGSSTRATTLVSLTRISINT